MKPVALMKRLGAGALLALLTQIPVQAQPAASAPAQAQASAPAPVEARTANLWSRLWRTADQRGQALLRQGHAAAAAQEFADPEHKAHAALLAADYAAAAQTLSGIDTAEAHYNRGNALAHAGDLQGAIKAYDAAIQRNPQHTDARHNRDLVAAALQKQKDEKKDSGKQDNKSGDKPADQQDGKQDGKPDAKSDDQQGGKPGDKPGAQQDAKAAGKPGDKPDNGQAGKPGNQAASAPQTGQASAPAAAASAAKDDAAQARRDAESTLKAPQPPASPQPGASGPQQGQGTRDTGKDRSAQAANAAPPVTEKQVAQDQWLRAIPDDPGGLLRRKFLIEHLLRQQGQKP